MKYSILVEMDVTTNGCSFDDDSIQKATANTIFCCCWQMKPVDETKKKNGYRTGLVAVTMFIDLGRGIHRKVYNFF